MFGNKKKEMSKVEQKAKLAALKDAHGMASDELKNKLAGAKKVSVVAKDDKSLKKGLELAEKIVGEQEDEDSDLGEKEENMAEGYEDQQESSEPMDEDEINAEIERLMKLKEKLQSQEQE